LYCPDRGASYATSRCGHRADSTDQLVHVAVESTAESTSSRYLFQRWKAWV
jgi:hypothetical protein